MFTEIICRTGWTWEEVGELDLFQVKILQKRWARYPSLEESMYYILIGLGIIDLKNDKKQIDKQAEKEEQSFESLCDAFRRAGGIVR